MSESGSAYASLVAFRVQAVLILLPFLLLSPLLGVVLLGYLGRPFDLRQSLEFTLALAAAASTTAGLLLALTFLLRGRAALRTRHMAWWWAIVPGCGIPIAAAISALMPASPPYTSLALFREHLQHYLIALPLLLPATHLAMERWLSNSTT